MILRLSIILMLILSSEAFAAKGNLSAKAGTWSFTTENVRSTSQTSSGVGAYAFELGYAVAPSWLLVFGFNLIMSDFVSGSAGYGFDLGTKYYPLSDAVTSFSETENSEITIHEKWRPYVGFFMRQRLFGLALSSSYLGPGLSLGLDYGLTDNLTLSAEFRYDVLYGSRDATAIQNNFLIGLGIEF
jgi:opacity protein-like surface antigen